MHFVDSSSSILTDLSSQGFAVGLGNFRNRDVFVHTNYRKDWQQYYQDKGLFSQDPVVTDGLRTTGFIEWPDPAKTQNIVMRTAADYGIKQGVTFSNRFAGHHCIVGITTRSQLTKAARLAITRTIQLNHIDHLIDRTEGLNDVQTELVALIANGYRAKDVAAYFEISENAVKQRKSAIQRHLGVNSFYSVVNLCAMAGRTIPRIR